MTLRCRTCGTSDRYALTPSAAAQGKKFGECKRCRSNWNRKFKYGISREEYDALQEKQKGKCGICWHPARVVDHDHETNKIRGLLCGDCNTALGRLGDNMAGLERAMDYLRRTTK